MSEADGVDEMVAGGLRVAVTAAGVVAEKVARARTERARQAAQESLAEARRLGAQYNAELAAARAQLSVVERDGWWDTAEARDVADVWETAQQWRAVDPDVDRAAQRIRSEVRDRYGVDVADGSAVDPDVLARAVRAREDAAAARAQGRRAAEDLEVALLVAAEEAEPNVVQDATVPLGLEDASVRVGERPAVPAQATSPDIAERVVAGLRAGRSPEVEARQAQLAEALAHVTDQEAVEARMIADLSFPQPAQAAVARAPRSAPKARKSRGVSAAPRQSERGMGR